MNSPSIPDVVVETGLVLDSIQIDSIDKTSDAVLIPELSVLSSVSDDRKILWITIEISLYSGTDKDRIRKGWLKGHAGYQFSEQVNPEIAKDIGVISHFGLAAYQRGAQIAENVFKMMGVGIVLPMGKTPKNSRPEPVAKSEP